MDVDNSPITAFEDSLCFHSSTDFVAMWKRQILLRHWSQPAKSEDKRGKHGRQIWLSQPPCFEREREQGHRFCSPAGNYRPRICMKVEKKKLFSVRRYLLFISFLPSPPFSLSFSHRLWRNFWSTTTRIWTTIITWKKIKMIKKSKQEVICFNYSKKLCNKCKI